MLARIAALEHRRKFTPGLQPNEILIHAAGADFDLHAS
jgi:hypothetical protein